MTSTEYNALASNPFRLYQLSQSIVPQDRNRDRAVIVARAFALAHEPSDVLAALRIARALTGLDLTGVLDGKHFAPFIAQSTPWTAHPDHGIYADDLPELRDMAHAFLDAVE
jgi:hypothetical protein